jgi:hypothetical protein
VYAIVRWEVRCARHGVGGVGCGLELGRGAWKWDRRCVPLLLAGYPITTWEALQVS